VANNITVKTQITAVTIRRGTNELDDRYVNASGDTMIGPITNMVGYYIGSTNIEHRYVNTAGDAMAGYLNMQTNLIIDVASINIGICSNLSTMTNTSLGTLNMGYVFGNSCRLRAQNYGAINCGLNNGYMMDAIGAGAFNHGFVSGESAFYAEGHGSEISGMATNYTTLRVKGNGSQISGQFYASEIGVDGHGSLVLGYSQPLDFLKMTNSGHGSIALVYRHNIIITNNACMVLGSGNSMEDNSMLCDVVRARVDMIGNGSGLTNLALSAYAGSGLAWTNSTLVVTNPVSSGTGTTNQLMDINGQTWTITNAPSAGNQYLIADPDTTNAGFGPCSASTTNIAWTDILDTPTDLSGFGITDAYTKIESDALYATGTPLYGFTETDPVFTNWLATNTYVETESDPAWVAASGAVWAAIGNTTNWSPMKAIAIGADQTQDIGRAWGPDGFIDISTGGVTLAINLTADWIEAGGHGDLLIGYTGTNPLTLLVTNTGTLRGWPVSLTNANGQIFIQKYQGTMTPCVTVFQ
jgi:hypothetical protein